MKKFFDYEEISYVNRELDKFIVENKDCERFVAFGNKGDTFFTNIANLLKIYNKTLVIIIPCMKDYPQDIQEASLKENVLIYETNKMGMRSVLNVVSQIYVKTKEKSILIPKEII